jgi:hypothetical protein
MLGSYDLTVWPLNLFISPSIAIINLAADWEELSTVPAIKEVRIWIFIQIEPCII